MKKLYSLFAVLFLFGCSELELTHEPRFTTGSDNFPDERDTNYPGNVAPGVPWGDPGPYNLSMYDLMVTFEDTPPAGKVPVQRWLAYGTTHNCNGRVTPFTWPPHYEYWAGAPAHDVHWHYIPSERYIDTYRNMDAGFLTLPGNPPAIPRGENVAFLNPAYFAGLGNVAAGNLQRSFTSEALVQWSIDWEYDGCHSADQAQTRCNEQHCLELKARSRDASNEGYGGWDNDSYDSDD